MSITRLFGIIIVLLGLGSVWLWQAYQQFVETPLNIPAEGAVYLLESGSSMRGIASDLQTAGFVDNADYLHWYARLQKKASRIRAGEYRLLPGMTADALLDLFISGKTIAHSLTLPEGWNFKQVLEALQQHPVLEQTLQGLTTTEAMDKLGLSGIHPEGRFFPDTYQFPRGTTDVAFLQRAYRKMQQEVKEAWSGREQKLPLKSAEEALILASIIEKETGLGSERPQISGVFTRRLRKGMKLQTDPTVIYGMGDNYKGNIRRKDLREDTPYNTYVHKGLPPTPIAMPGRDALQAAVHPAKGKALYFVSRGDGSHVFSATLKQHNAAVRKYQLKR